MKHNIPFSTVIFDLDGTLVNTVPDVRLALNKTLALYGSKQISLEDLYPLIGHGARSMIERAFAKVDIHPTHFHVENALSRYIGFYKNDPVVETEIYPGVVDVLTELKNKNIRLAICTNKPSVMTKIVVKQLQLEHFFDVILAGDEIKTPKPHGEHIHEILRRMNIKDLSAVLVGDSDVDRMTALNAGIPFVGVTYGYSAKGLESAILIDHMHELHAALEKAARGII